MRDVWKYSVPALRNYLELTSFIKTCSYRKVTDSEP